MTAKPSPEAVHDADLVRYLDGELDAADRKRVEDALAADSALSQRLQQLRDRGARLTSLLEATDADPAGLAAPMAASPASAAGVIELNAAWAAQQGVEPHVVPPPRSLPGWLRAAAVLALLFTGSLLVPPVRAWIAGALASVTGGGGEGGAGDQPVAVVPIDTLEIRFSTAASAYAIEFAAAPAGGRLVVERWDDDMVSAAVYTASGGEEVQRIRDDLLRLANSAASMADYHVAIPPAVAEVVVRVPGREDGVWRFGAGEPERRSLEFGRGVR